MTETETVAGKPCIICVAITGSVPTKENNPAVPITVEEQVESTQEAFEAGASIAHCHVRNDYQTPTSDPERFARLNEGLEKHCPGMIFLALHRRAVGGRQGAGRDAAAPARHGLALRPLEQLLDPGLRELARPGGLAGAGDVHLRNGAGGLGVRSVPHPAGDLLQGEVLLVWSFLPFCS
jgi:Uncharacterized conserved protein